MPRLNISAITASSRKYILSGRTHGGPRKVAIADATGQLSEALTTVPQPKSAPADAAVDRHFVIQANATTTNSAQAAQNLGRVNVRVSLCIPRASIITMSPADGERLAQLGRRLK